MRTKLWNYNNTKTGKWALIEMWRVTIWVTYLISVNSSPLYHQSSNFLGPADLHIIFYRYVSIRSMQYLQWKRVIKGSQICLGFHRPAISSSLNFEVFSAGTLWAILFVSISVLRWLRLYQFGKWYRINHLLMRFYDLDQLNLFLLR
jgi:hypothetical protein